MVDQGWTGIAVAEDAGGVGLGWVEVAVSLEEVGAHVAPAPILQQIVALDALAGTRVGRTAARGRRGGVRRGVRSPRGRALRAVGRRRRVRARRRARRVRAGVDDASPPWTSRGGRLARPAASGDAAVARRSPMQSTRSSISWGDGICRRAARGAQRLLDLSVEYAKDRVQFDKPIGSFQAVKHRLADMLVDVEGMRSAVYYAAWCIAAVARRSSRSRHRRRRRGAPMRRTRAQVRAASPRRRSASRGSTTCTSS